MFWFSVLKPRQQAAVCLAAVLLATAGCSGDSGAKPTASGGNSIDKVTYVTGLGLSGQHAGGVLVAKAKGYFSRVNIDVEVQKGEAGDVNLQRVASGRAQFAAIDYAGAVVRAGNGQFDDFRLIGVLQVKTTNGIMALQSSGIRTAKDLVGKTVGVPGLGAAPKLLWPAYARIVGLSAKEIGQVKWQPSTGQLLPGLLAAHKVDAIGQFAPAAPTVSKAAGGAAITTLPYGDYMTDLYGAVVVARKDVSPDLARRFMQGLVDGQQYAVDHPDEAGDIMVREGPLPKSGGVAAADELRAMKGYVGSPEADRELVARSFAILQGVGAVPSTAAIDPNTVFNFDIARGVRAR